MADVHQEKDCFELPGAVKIALDHLPPLGFEPVIIATKLDKIKRSQIQKQIGLIRQGLDAAENTAVIPYSAQTKQGREEIYTLLDAYLEERL